MPGNGGEGIVTQESGSSYGRILKSSALLGGSSVINVGLAALRTKLLAVWLGPALFGVMGLYIAITGLIGTFASLGLGQSAVRDIAEAAGSGDELRVARTVRAYRRIVWLTGVGGLMLAASLAIPMSYVTFGDPSHAWALLALSLVVLFGQLRAGQTALVQGMRRIREMSAMTVAGAVASTVVAIPTLFLFREHAAVPFLLAAAAVQMIASWWYARRIPLIHSELTWKQTWSTARPMILMGVTFTLTGAVAAGSEYTIRLIVQRWDGESSVGLYHAAFTLSAVYIGFILQAMSGDYYPRLACAAASVDQRNCLVNEQTEAAILLAVPTMTAGLVFSDGIISALYSPEFGGAISVLRWQMLGMMGRITSWPVGFLLIALGDKRAIAVSELLGAGAHVGLVLVGVASLGLQGAGMAFAGTYGLYMPLVYYIARKRHGFTFDRGTLFTIRAGTFTVVAALGTTYIPDPTWRVSAGTLVLAVATTACLQRLALRLGHDSVWAAVRLMLSRFRPRAP